MASIRNRNGVWQARVTRKGQEPVSKSFTTRHDAERWARKIETQIDQGRFVSLKQDERITLGELVGRYRAEVTPQMKSAEADSIKLLALMRNPLCKLTMISLTPARIAEFRDQRLKQVTAGTVIRELAYFSSVINHARREWGINVENPVRLVRKPPSPQGRSRVVSEAELVRTKALELGGYRVVQAESIAEGTLSFSTMINRSDSEAIKLIIVDLGLPDGDGASLIRWVRTQSSVPLIIISARYDDNSKVNLLDAGADDYLVKPFSFTELMARIRVAMRHRHQDENPAPRIYRASGIEIDLQRHQVIRHGERVRLTPTEFKLLERLMLQSGQVVTHRQLLADVWGAEFVEHTHYLRLYMAQLRNKLEEVPSQPKLLITEPGIGYRLSEAEPI